MKQTKYGLTQLTVQRNILKVCIQRFFTMISITAFVVILPFCFRPLCPILLPVLVILMMTFVSGGICVFNSVHYTKTPVVSKLHNYSHHSSSISFFIVMCVVVVYCIGSIFFFFMLSVVCCWGWHRELLVCFLSCALCVCVCVHICLRILCVCVCVCVCSCMHNVCMCAHAWVTCVYVRERAKNNFIMRWVCCLYEGHS